MPCYSAFVAMKKESITLEIAEMIAQGMKSLGYDIQHPHSKKIFLGHAKKKLKNLESGGTLLVNRDKNFRLKAAVIISQGSLVGQFKPDFEHWNFEFICRPGDKKALLWIEKQLAHLVPYLVHEIDGVIYPWQLSLMPKLKKYKIFPASFTLLGEVDLALALLKKKYPKEELSFSPASKIKVVTPSTRQEADDYIEIIRSEFTRNPQFGSFVAHPSFIKFLRNEFYISLKKRRPNFFVFKRGEKVVGGVEYSIKKKTLGGRRHAGVGVNFEKSVQGMGYSKIAYRVVLEELKRQKVHLFSGGTAQVGVMKLGRVMNRKVQGVLMQKLEKPFFKEGFLEGWIRKYDRR